MLMRIFDVRKHPPQVFMIEFMPLFVEKFATWRDFVKNLFDDIRELCLFDTQLPARWIKHCFLCETDWMPWNFQCCLDLDIL